MRKLLLVFFACLVTLYSIAQPGSNDPTFNTADVGFGKGKGADYSILTTAILPDSKILIAGGLGSYNGTSAGRIAKLNPDGSIDPSFNEGNTGASFYINAMAILPDGKILIVGDFTSYNNVATGYIARLNADGTLDNTFNSGGAGADQSIKSIALQTVGGKTQILIGGSFTKYNGTSVKNLARLTVDGALDPSFNSGGVGADNTVQAISVQSDGKIVIGGAFTLYNSLSRNRIARLNIDGTLDSGFDPGMGANSGISSIALQTVEGKEMILIAGYFSQINGVNRLNIARLNTNGSLDASFNNSGQIISSGGAVVSIAVQSNGNIVLGGYFTQSYGLSRNYITRLNADGTLDGSFDPGFGASENLNSVSIQADGKIIVGGNLKSFNGVGCNYVARLNTNGSPDITFNPGTGVNGNVSTMRIQPSDNKIMIAGNFTSVNGIGRGYIARINADGSLDASFNPGLGTNSVVTSMLVQSDGNILVGGGFYYYNGTLVNKLIRVNSAGTLDGSFNMGASGPNNAVTAIATQTLSGVTKILIAGEFTSYNSTSRPYIARLNMDGSLDNTFSAAGLNNSIKSMAVQSDGKIVIVGYFTLYNGTSRNYIARLNSDGSLDDSFDPGTGFNGLPYSLALQNDGKILVGGSFATYNKLSCRYICRLNIDGTLDNFNTGGLGANSIVSSLFPQSDGKILIGGYFTSFNGVNRSRIARLNTNGSLDASFDPGTGANAVINSMVVRSDNKVLIGGDFISYNGVGRNSIALLNGGDLSLGDITGTTFCPGNTVRIPYSATVNYNDDNMLSFQLSDKSGKFTSPIILGKLSFAGHGAGYIDVKIPDNVPYGTGYRIRVVSSSPVVNSSDNGTNLTINSTFISTQPASKTVCANSPVTFSVATGGGTPTNYQWKKDGNDISGATTSSYSITNAVSTDNAYYSVVVTGCGNVTSSSVRLTVNPETSITTQPSSQTITAGTPVTFTVVANGSGTISYQWQKDNSNISGATSSSFTINSANTSHIGDYKVIVHSGCGSDVTSDIASLSVNRVLPDMTFTSSVTKTYGDADFTASATSTNPAAITYTSSDDAVATIASDGKVHIIKSGIVTITASQAQDNTYEAVSESQTLTINKAPLVITADNKTKTQGSANPTLSISYSGFVKGETSSVLTTQPTVSTTATDASAAGIYTIAVKDASADNYEITYQEGKLTVLLPVNGIKVSSTSVSCKGSADGAISMTATQPGNYTATVTSGSTTNTYSFTDTKQLTGLTPGTYTVCVAAEGMSDHPVCFTQVITEPKDLSAYARVNQNERTVTVDLQGGNAYQVQLNGQVYQTTNGQITLPLKTGANHLKVSTEKYCQGVVEKDLVWSNDPVVYPNPFNETVNLYLGAHSAQKAIVVVRDLTGKVVYTSSYVQPVSLLQVRLPGLASGVYMLQLNLDNSISTHKIIKQ